MPRPSEGGEPAGRVLVDVSDLLMYLSHHPVVSGIQRVLVEVAPHLEARSACEYVCFDPGRGSLVVLDPDRIRTALAWVREGGGDEAEFGRQVRALLAGTGECQVLSSRPGDVVAVLGAAWIYGAPFFAALKRAKEQGAAVVVLLYDLIPVVFPGFPADVVKQFREYVPRVAAVADRAPAISMATRRDFESYCGRRGWPVPAGAATGLAGDQWSLARTRSLRIDPAPAWPRPFVLFVSTIEVRKNHLLALHAWRRLVEELGREHAPDLVCVGRLGWNAFEFLAEFSETEGLDGRVHVLTESVPDSRLAALYRDCLFTIYPSRYEGWGLPVGESLDMGKPVVVARTSSLPEVGGDLARYFVDDDVDSFIEAMRPYLVEPGALARDSARIEREHAPMTWAQVAAALEAEMDLARAAPRPVDRSIELGEEYGPGHLASFHGTALGQDYLGFLDTQRLPLTGQHSGTRRALVAELVVDPLPQADGFRLAFRRPIDGELTVVLCLAGSPAVREVSVAASGSVRTFRVHRGALAVPLGPGMAGMDAVVEVSGPRRRAGLRAVRSFVVLADDQVAAELVRRGPVVRQSVLSGPTAQRARRALSGGPREVTARVRRRLGRQ